MAWAAIGAALTGAAKGYAEDYDPSYSNSGTPTQKAITDYLINLYTPRMVGGKTRPIYEGDRVAGLTGTQTSALSGVGDNISALSNPNMPMYGETGQALSGLLSGQSGASKISPDQYESYFKSVYEDPTRKAWKEELRPTIQEEYAGPGYWGSSRAKAVTKGAGDVQSQLGTDRAQLAWDVNLYNKDLDEAKANRAQTAVSQGIQYGQAPGQDASAKVSGLGQAYTIAQQEQIQQQMQIEANMELFAEKNRLTDPEDMEIMMALLGMNFSESRGVEGPNDWQRALGGAATGLSNMMSMPSFGGGSSDGGSKVT